MDNDDNVIGIGSKPKPDTEEEAAAMTFAEIAVKNAENKERLRLQRIKDNQKVTRTYRLKD